MQNAIGSVDTSSATDPILDLWIQVPLVVDDGTGATLSQLAAPVSLAWSIASVSTETEGLAPAVVATGTVDLTADKVAGVVGHYAAATAPADWSTSLPGRYAITWSFVLVLGGPTGRARREFDLVAGSAPADLCHAAYCLVSDMREEGVRAKDASDMRLLRSIHLASRAIEGYTGRFFEPRYQSISSDGTGGRAVQFDDPLIAVQGISLGNPVQSNVGLGSLRLYNRHITARLTNPDDRDNPMVEFVHYRDIFGRQRSASIDSPLFGVPFRDLFFPAGVQNVNVTGLWGYTDWDGSPCGATPYMIRHACKLIVQREWRKLTDDLRDDRKRYRLTSERTRDQSYNLDKVTEGPFTGDREIDDILLRFHRPAGITCA